MIFQFGQYKIDADVDRTREFYKNARFISENCECSGCRNYEKAINSLPNEIVQFFDSLGIDMRKAAEVWAIMAKDDITVIYSGFYHLCGILLDGDSASIKVTAEDSNLELCHWSHEKTYSLSKDYHIALYDQCGYLIEDDFPCPVLEIEIEANIPWVLNEENPYDKSKNQPPAVSEQSFVSKLKNTIIRLIYPTRRQK